MSQPQPPPPPSLFDSRLRSGPRLAPWGCTCTLVVRRSGSQFGCGTRFRIKELCVCSFLFFRQFVQLVCSCNSRKMKRNRLLAWPKHFYRLTDSDVKSDQNLFIYLMSLQLLAGYCTVQYTPCQLKFQQDTLASIEYSCTGTKTIHVITSDAVLNWIHV